jgi:hypothetical protein
MSKTNKLWIALELVFLIVFNAMFFMIGGVEHQASIWISYAFIHLAYLLTAATLFMTNKRKSYFILGLSLYSISSAYFMVELVTGLIFIFISLDGYIITFLAQLFIAGIYAVAFISALIANEHTAESDERQTAQISYVKTMVVELSNMMTAATDRTVKKALEKVYDEVAASPVKSHTNILQYEGQIVSEVDQLKYLISSGENAEIIKQANSVLSMVKKRNRQLSDVSLWKDRVPPSRSTSRG